MVELLRGTSMNDRQLRMVDTLHGSAESLLYLINDVLDVSKIEAGKLELDPLDFSPRRAVEDVALLFAERAQQKGVDLMVVVSAAVPESVHADGHRFRQVLNNLVSNAVKFTASGAIRVDLDAALDGAEVVLSVCVSDSGIGIAEEIQPRLFQAFTQADGSMARRYGGTGLGLVISRQLVELLGGTLDFTSVAGEGARFFFTIRAALRQGPAPAACDGLRVGVVVGKRMLREALVEQVRALGCTVDAFAAGAALDAALAGGARFDALLVDSLVDGEPGHALILRHRDAVPNIVALTRMNARSDEQDARQSGARQCLAKPVLSADLSAALRGEATGPTPARRGMTTLRTDARVLVAEDHPVNAEIVAALLGECGCRVTLASDGRQAVEACRNGTFDLVLMDIQMPGMDGVEATRQIRALEGEGARVPIVALTANALRDDRKAALAVGMNDYLTKPVTGQRLRDALLRWLPEALRTEVAEAPPAVDPDDGEDAAEWLDLAVLRSMPGVNGALDSPLLARLVDLFMRETRKQLDELEAALAAGRVEDAQAQAHKLKSAAAAVGEARLAQHARGLDVDLRAGETADRGRVLGELREAFAGYAHALESHGVAPDGVPSTQGGQAP
ncbi:MAG: response regulator [Rhodocyclaceae bacterium]|nr:response regulator [Rhodocyclaceae bacterium]